MNYHVPVLLEEVVDLLEPQPGDVAVDLTLGGGGYAQAILDKLGAAGKLIGIDQDEDALAEAGRRLRGYPGFTAVKGNFGDFSELLDERAVGEVNRCVLDLGVSSHQLDRLERGFSFRGDAPLDMRMDRDAAGTAADLLAVAEWEELVRILREYGEERYASSIARAVVREREKAPIETTGQLVRIIEGAVPAAARRGPIHPATRTFQALRIAVNRELEQLERVIPQIVDRLAPGGRLAVVAYHSLEDRIVKEKLLSYSGRCVCPREFPVCRCNPVRVLEIVTRKPVRPGPEEVERNPRSRSARLRVAERVGRNL
ncbi:MAG: ribosomal RNA small subunit methyltransferase H [Candidatus Xenobia bacterium]